MSDLYLNDQRDAVEHALARETTAWTPDEDGVALLEAYHARWEPEVWDDWTVFPIDHGDLRDVVNVALTESDGQLENVAVVECDSCGDEDLVFSIAYDEADAAADPAGWQILVPEGDDPWMDSRIVNCPRCTVARSSLTTERLSYA